MQKSKLDDLMFELQKQEQQQSKESPRLGRPKPAEIAKAAVRAGAEGEQLRSKKALNRQSIRTLETLMGSLQGEIGGEQQQQQQQSSGLNRRVTRLQGLMKKFNSLSNLSPGGAPRVAIRIRTDDPDEGSLTLHVSPTDTLQAVLSRFNARMASVAHKQLEEASPTASILFGGGSRLFFFLYSAKGQKLDLATRVGDLPVSDRALVASTDGECDPEVFTNTEKSVLSNSGDQGDEEDLLRNPPDSFNPSLRSRSLPSPELPGRQTMQQSTLTPISGSLSNIESQSNPSLSAKNGFSTDSFYNVISTYDDEQQ